MEDFSDVDSDAVDEKVCNYYQQKSPVDNKTT
jgi:hypothetical protein